ncbi:MAG: hypothetical protein RLZZ24_704 [Pseudomonadota bacterium]
MPKAKLQAATVGGNADGVEAAFYEALQSGDIDKLMSCWADEEDIVCVHPGGGRLIGAAEIREVFEALFANGTISVYPMQVHKVESLTSAVHSVIERIDVLTNEGPRQAQVIATNVYQRTAQGWRMVAHHASPGAAVEVTNELTASTPSTLH